MRATVPLPEPAANRLRNLQLARMAAEDAVRAATGRINMLRDGDQEMVRQLTVERDRQNHRFGQLSQLLSRVQQWIGELCDGITLEPAPAIDIKLKDGERLVDAINTPRPENKAVRERLATVRNAPLPTSDQRALIEEYVLRLHRQARPAINIMGDAVRVSWRGDV